jgi:DNA-binding response OmpR family regulator
MANQLIERNICALLLGTFENEWSLVNKVFQQAGWRLVQACSRRQAFHCLVNERVQVVIAESQLPDGDWKNVLAELDRLPSPPNLIVASHLADDRLWAEVLNIGGYDVLAQPFEAEELRRVVASAGRRYGCRAGAGGSGQTPRVFRAG